VGKVKTSDRMGCSVRPVCLIGIDHDVVPLTGAVRWCTEWVSKKSPASGAGLQGGRSETLEGSYLTFTPNISALHSVPMTRRRPARHWAVYSLTRRSQRPLFWAITIGCPKN